MVASPSSPDGPVRFEIPLRGVIRDVDPSRCQMSTAGYARVSTDQQSLDQQRDALTAAGCERLFTDQLFGVRDDRPGLAALLTTPVLATWWWSWLSTASAVRCPRSSAPSRPSPRPGCCCARCARAPTTPLQPDGARRHLRRPGGPRARAHERTRRRGPARPPAPAAGHLDAHPSSLRPKPAKSGRSASAGNRSPSSSLATAWPSTPRAIRPLPDRPRPTTGGTCEPFNLRIQETALARRR
jgi:hypothetical protein